MTTLLQHLVRQFVRLLSLPLIATVNLTLRAFDTGRVIRIVVMDSRYFGHQALEPEVFWNEWQSAVECGSRDYWFCCLGPRRNSSNPFLWGLTKRKFPVLPSWFVTSVAHWSRRFRFESIVLQDASIYRLNFLTSRETTLPVGDAVVARRSQILSRLAEPDRPYVVFTIREFNPLDDHNDLRNRQIADFSLGMSELVHRGFNVIRLMSKTQDPLIAFDRHHLDWQVERDGEPGDELVLLSGAAFVVSTTTGGDCLALGYRRPVLYIDCARFFLVFLGTELASFSVPLMYDIQSKEQLGLGALLERGLGWVGDQRLFTKAGVMVAPSDPERLRSQIVEYVVGLTAGWSISQEAAQQEWRETLGNELGSEIDARHGQVRARMLDSSIDEFVN